MTARAAAERARGREQPRFYEHDKAGFPDVPVGV
jgi:hypothetical protein